MKILKVLAISSVVSLVGAAGAFAATFTDAGGTVGTPPASVKPSKGVTVKYTPEAAGATYSITAMHGSGTKTYGSSSGDTKIFMKDTTTIADPPAAPAAGASADFSTWTAL